MTELQPNERTITAGRNVLAEGNREAPVVGDLGGEDELWDWFLQSTPLGSFQQSSLWGRVKARERWTPFRSVVRADGRLVGGYQWLERKGRLGRIAYVSKGPVVERESASDVALVLDDLLRHARARRVTALVLQPPDVSVIGDELLKPRGFVVEDLMKVITSTLVVDLTGGIERVESGIRKSTRVEIRQARRRGACVRVGGVSDATRFFELMASTCVRQGVSPNPPSPDAVREILESFGARGCVRLTFAECEGEWVAGILALLFGSKIYIWKKGWNGKHGRLYPNALLYQESFEWACSQGYREVDFMGLDRRTAEALLGGQALSGDALQSRDQFHLGFGGQPRLLPSSYLWIANPAVRLVFKFLIERSWGRRWLKKLV
ncbi:MAG: GNAT family N-acetyltransferase [Verrucomicrobiales bacterium]|nr:GNAT family N-acetyltransferase [Verrucomicrobiales bacterium]